MNPKPPTSGQLGPAALPTPHLGPPTRLSPTAIITFAVVAALLLEGAGFLIWLARREPKPPQPSIGAGPQCPFPSQPGGLCPPPTEEQTPELPTGSGIRGEAYIEITGELQSTLDLTLFQPVSSFSPPGEMTLSWTNPEGDIFSVRGQASLGATPSSNTLVVELFLRSGHVFMSTAGECALDLARVDAKGLDAKVDCSDLASGMGPNPEHKVIDAAGTFSVSA